MVLFFRSKFSKGVVGFAALQAIASGGVTISLAKDAIFNPEKFALNPYELAGNFRRIIEMFRANGMIIPESINPDKIHTSDCPKEEFYEQMRIVTREELTDLDVMKSNLLVLVAILSIAEESIFRGLLQDVILKRFVAKMVSKIAPKHVSKLDSKIYTACRILISSAAFAAIHSFNRVILSDEYVDRQIYYTFGLGIILGVFKEVGGLAPCIGAHAINNLTSLLPSIVAEC